MLGLKIFVRVQTFWRRPFVPLHNFCHPAEIYTWHNMYWSIYSLQKTSQHSLMTAVSKGRSLEKKCFREFWTVLHRGCLQVKYAIKKWKLVKMKQGARWTFICLLTFAQALKREFCWFRKILCLTIPNSFAKSLEKEKFQGEGLGWGGVIWGWGYLMCPPPPFCGWDGWMGWLS